MKQNGIVASKSDEKSTAWRKPVVTTVNVEASNSGSTGAADAQSALS